MGFIELARSRWSVRRFSERKVDDALVEELLEAARTAPSAANRQPYQVIVLHTEGREDELRRIYDRDWFVTAPVVLCGCTVPAQAWTRMDGRGYEDFDLALAMDHLMLAAAERGLGTCLVAAFDPDVAREVLGIPESAEPVVFAALGHPAEAEAPPKERKPLAGLVRYEHW
jgi:nitroreductase